MVVCVVAFRLLMEIFLPSVAQGLLVDTFRYSCGRCTRANEVSGLQHANGRRTKDNEN